VTGLFLIITGVLFFTTFFLQNRASLRNMFSLMPIVLSFFIPALTMRLYSEEKRSGSIETLYTLPVTEFDAVCGKFLAALVSSAVMVAPTMLYLIGILPFGLPEPGPVFGGYLGTVFLCAAFSAIGVFASSVTKKSDHCILYSLHNLHSSYNDQRILNLPSGTNCRIPFIYKRKRTLYFNLKGNY
jgi:ABC-2 type transport system permease protein